MSIQKPQKKLYYSLRQTASMVGLTPDNLKSWEKEYSQLKPRRNRAGNRYYTDKDLTLLFQIKAMLVEKKWAVEKIRHYLKTNGEENTETEPLRLKKALAEIKMEISEILEILNEPLK